MNNNKFKNKLNMADRKSRIVRGPAGKPGPMGLDGPPGERGSAGPEGPIGKIGPRGERGEIGPEGPQGEKGDKGEIGKIGPMGLDGKRGSMGLDGNSCLNSEIWVFDGSTIDNKNISVKPICVSNSHSFTESIIKTIKYDSSKKLIIDGSLSEVDNFKLNMVGSNSSGEMVVRSGKLDRSAIVIDMATKNTFVGAVTLYFNFIWK